MNLSKKVGVVAAAAMTLGAGGIGVLKLWEGKENNAYKDVVGVWTVCYGSTGPHVTPGLRVSDEGCEQMLRDDVVRFERAAQRCSAPASLNQNQYDALVVFTYNVGETAYCNSTLSRKVRAGDFAGASAEFPRWSYAKGQFVQGLANRRAAERYLFNTPVKSTDAPPPVVVAPNPASHPAPGLAPK